MTLDVTKYGEFNDPGMMGHRIAYGATTQINRKEFGLTLNMMLDGRFVVSDEIQITIEGEWSSSRRPKRRPPAADPSVLADDSAAGGLRSRAGADGPGRPPRPGRGYSRPVSTAPAVNSTTRKVNAAVSPCTVAAAAAGRGAGPGQVGGGGADRDRVQQGGAQ